MITLEQIEATRSRLLSLLTYLTVDQVNLKPDANTWSIAQVIQHIAAIEGLTPEIIRLGLAEKANYVSTELNLDQRVVDRSSKFNAPPNLHPTDATKTFEELLQILDQSHSKFIQALNSVQGDSRLDITSPPMPHMAFGKMSISQWIEFTHYHEVRHILQIEELIEWLRDK